MRIARLLAFGRLISLSGGSAAYIALVAAIYGETGSALWVSAAIFSSVVASVASAPFAGWIGYHVGPLLGGAVLGVGASPATLFAVDAATFVFSALVVVSIRRPFGRGSTQ